MFKNNRISNVVLVGLLFGIFLPIAISFIFFSNTYKERSEQTIHIISDSIRVSATEALWFFSQEWIDIVVESAIMNKKVYSATLYNHKNKQIAHKQKYLLAENTKKLSIPLKKQEDIIGTLVLVFDMDAINQDIYIEKENLIVILFLQAIISSLILYYIIKFKVLDPIRILIFQSKLVSNKKLDKEFIWKQKDEFGELGKALDKTRISLSKMFLKLEEKIIYDNLTQVYNRYGFEKIFAKEVKRCNRYNRSLSIIMIDIDFFKKVNDKYGHLVGDNVLIQVCNVIQNEIRESDYLVRWGGEEFIIISPETNLEKSIELAEKVRKIIEKTNFESVGNITISLAAVEKDENEETTHLVKRADDLLYYAKDSGRNKTSFKI